MTQTSDQIKVIGAGWGRTGTSSLKVALDILGYNTYHMKENFKHAHYKFWIKVSNEFHERENCDKPLRASFDEIFKHDKREQYTATCDWPSAPYWEEQLEQYPDAKVILTVREPEAWYKSCINTIFQTATCTPHSDWIMRLLPTIGIPSPYMNEFFYKNIGQDSLNHKWSKNDVLAAFNRHNDEVKRRCPKEKLLVYELKQGWEPLCKFLNKPIPDVPFPHVNDTKEFQRLIFTLRTVTIVGLVTVVVIPLLASLWYLYF